MYAFAFELNGQMEFIAYNDKIFTYPTAALAQVDFKRIRDQAHLYSIHPNLGVATLLERGSLAGALDEFEPTEIQKCLLYKSFVYKSLLEWVPDAEENMPQV